MSAKLPPSISVNNFFISDSSIIVGNRSLPETGIEDSEPSYSWA